MLKFRSPFCQQYISNFNNYNNNNKKRICFRCFNKPKEKQGNILNGRGVVQSKREKQLSIKCDLHVRMVHNFVGSSVTQESFDITRYTGELRGLGGGNDLPRFAVMNCKTNEMWKCTEMSRNCYSSRFRYRVCPKTTHVLLKFISLPYKWSLDTASECNKFQEIPFDSQFFLLSNQKIIYYYNKWQYLKI